MNDRERPLNDSQPFYVDIPTEECVHDDSGAWHNLGQFDTEQAALAFAQEHFGADHRGRVLLVPSQMNERLDRLESAATDMAAVLESEVAALRIWQSAESYRGALALPDDIWDGMTISIDKIEAVLRKAGIDAPPRTENRVRLRQIGRKGHGEQRRK